MKELVGDGDGQQCVAKKSESAPNTDLLRFFPITRFLLRRERVIIHHVDPVLPHQRMYTSL